MAYFSFKSCIVRKRQGLTLADSRLHRRVKKLYDETPLAVRIKDCKNLLRVEIEGDVTTYVLDSNANY